MLILKNIFNKFYKTWYTFCINIYCIKDNYKQLQNNSHMSSALEYYNSESFNNKQMYIISVRSKSFAKFLNEKSPSFGQKLKEFEEHNNILNKISKQLFNKFNPTMIYTFNDEFLLIFNRSLVNTNINKQLTSITSYITRLLTLELINQDINLDFTMSAKWISFSNDKNIFKYIVSRQNRCTLLNLNLLYNYFEKSDRLPTYILLNKFTKIPESSLINDFIIYGNICYYYKFSSNITIKNTKIQK